LKEIAGNYVRQVVIELSRRARVGHIGSALSVADLLAVLYGRVARIASPGDPDRDRVILSKGHAAAALYAVLHARGWISAEELETFCGDDSTLGVHPDISATGVDFATGSLGIGLSLGVGSALAARLSRSSRRTFVLMSDAECNEGSVWEAAMFAAQHRLSSLTAIIDFNGMQALGPTQDILDQSNIAERWRAFGWHADEIDGHDEHAIQRALVAAAQAPAPVVVIARTRLGKGVSFMEGQLASHYWPLSDAQAEQALRELSTCTPS